MHASMHARIHTCLLYWTPFASVPAFLYTVLEKLAARGQRRMWINETKLGHHPTRPCRSAVLCRAELSYVVCARACARARARVDACVNDIPNEFVISSRHALPAHTVVRCRYMPHINELLLRYALPHCFCTMPYTTPHTHACGCKHQ